MPEIKKVKVIKDVYVKIEPYTIWKQWENKERWLKEVRYETKEWLENFFRDHRSQDDITANVVEETEDRCSHCDDLWDPTRGYEESGEDPNKLYCGGCGHEVTELVSNAK